MILAGAPGLRPGPEPPPSTSLDKRKDSGGVAPTGGFRYRKKILG